LGFGETLLLKAQAAPDVPEPVNDVLFGSIVAARDRFAKPAQTN
jgi:hypothetical protein